MHKVKKVVLLCPFFGDPGFIGSFRARRILNWFEREGWSVSIVRAGRSDHVEDVSFGRIVSVKDPLLMYGELDRDGSFLLVPRKPNRLRRWLGYALLVPDPSIVWSRRIRNNATVLNELRDAALIFNTSPPESPFLVGAAWARQFSVPFWMDMRDGWLDEPMKPFLLKYRLHRFREKRLERRCLHEASVVTVTSETWRQLLIGRYPRYGDKTLVLTNASPATVHRTPAGDPAQACAFRLIYGGRLTISRPHRDAGELLRPLVGALRNHPECNGSIDFVGTFTSDEIDYLKTFSLPDMAIRVLPAIPREMLLMEMADAAGLLLLSPSMGSIPAKFFDYLSVGRPILAQALKGSALDTAMAMVDHGTVIYSGSDAETQHRIERFIIACKGRVRKSPPHCFTEDAVFETFQKIVRQLPIAKKSG